MEKPVMFSSGPFRLCGILGTPTTPAPEKRGVILIHGWGGYRIGAHNLLVRTARALSDAGLPTLRFDLRGRGDSDGDATRTSLDDMIWDAVAAVDYFETEAGVTEPILLGICSGANVAIGASTFRPKVKTLALWSTLPFQPEQRMNQRIRRMSHYLREYAFKAFRPQTWARLFKGQVNIGGVGRAMVGEKKPSLDGKNLKDSDRDIMKDFARYQGKALFVLGSEDPEGREGYNVFSRFCARNHIAASFHTIPGATHSYYSSDHSRELISVTMDFLGLHPGKEAPEGA